MTGPSGEFGLPPPKAPQNLQVGGDGLVQENVIQSKTMPNAAVADTLSQANKENIGQKGLEGLPPPVMRENVKGSEKIRGKLGAGNPWLNVNVMVGVRIALETAVRGQAEQRRESREAALEATMWLKEQGEVAAEQILTSGLKQAEMLEADAAQHFTNGIIMAASAAATALTFVGTRVGSSMMKNRSQEYKAAVTEKSVAQGRVDNPAANATPRQIRQDKAALAKANDKVSGIDQHYAGTANQVSMTLNQIINQVQQSATSFTSSATDYKKAELQKVKAYAEHIQKMAETWEKIASKMQQSTDADAKEAADQIAKMLQALDQIISTGYKSFGIGVHG